MPTRPGERMNAELFRVERIATLSMEIRMLKERYHDKICQSAWIEEDRMMWDNHIVFKEIELNALEHIKEKLEE